MSNSVLDKACFNCLLRKEKIAFRAEEYAGDYKVIMRSISKILSGDRKRARFIVHLQ